MSILYGLNDNIYMETSSQIRFGFRLLMQGKTQFCQVKIIISVVICITH